MNSMMYVHRIHITCQTKLEERIINISTTLAPYNCSTSDDFSFPNRRKQKWAKNKSEKHLKQYPHSRSMEI
ncbi:hypothetical protein M8J75_009112 [Diaphorina citri]|nr:hypothetical protein M8J75_009112 [Diaphorina citri]